MIVVVRALRKHSQVIQNKQKKQKINKKQLWKETDVWNYMSERGL